MKEYIGFISVENEVCIDEYYPIVRCKDCSLQDDIKYCERLGFYVGDDGYCAWPKRREPYTVEDVLRDCCNEWSKHCGDDWEIGVYAKYADKLRELIKENK